MIRWRLLMASAIPSMSLQSFAVVGECCGLGFRGLSRALSPNGRVLRHPGDLQWLERRRVQAAELFAQGKTRAEVAASWACRPRPPAAGMRAGVLAVWRGGG